MILFKVVIIYLIHKEIGKMSYDEKVQQLLETAADYTAVTSSFNLESTLYAQVFKSSIDTVKQAIEKLLRIITNLLLSR